MALLFIDGFDKYGSINSNGTAVLALLTAGEWTSATGSPTIVAGLSATGSALQLFNAASVTKTLSGSSARLIGGVRFSASLVLAAGIQFLDAGSNQAGITFNSAGTFSVRNASYSSGTILGTSTASVTASSIHYLEWDITFSNSGSYQLWLDGTSILSGSGDTTTTANSSANGVTFVAQSSASLTIDDLYVFDISGSTNNAVLLTSPRIETQYPTGDAAIQFGIGAAVLGSSVSRSGPASNAANQWRARSFTPSRNCTLNSIAFLPLITSGALNFRPIIYSDSAGLPATLLSTGSTVTGMTANVPVIMPLTTPQTLTAGTPYWLGFMSDVVTGGSSLAGWDGNSADRIGVSTFSGGAPATPPSLSPAVTVTMWGNITGVGVNWYEVGQNPPMGNNSYVFDTTVGHEDLYTYPALSVPPTNIYAVAVKGYLAKSDSGTKTVSLRMKSGATDSGGSLTGQALGTSYGWLGSFFPTDPNTSAAWTGSALNAATSGVRVDS